MAVTLLRHVVDDISTDLRQIFDDKEVQKIQVAYWTLIVANRLRAQHIEKRSSGAFLHTYIVSVLKQTVTTNPDEVINRKYITLPKCIYDFDNDNGIEFLAYYRNTQEAENCPPDYTRTQFDRTTHRESRRLYMSTPEKPSASQPYFIRKHDTLELLGIECVDVAQVEIGIYQAFDAVTTINIDQPFDFPEELLVILKRQVLDMGRFALLMPEENTNDGRSSIQSTQVPQNKLVSVNDPLLNPDKD